MTYNALATLQIEQKLSLTLTAGQYLYSYSFYFSNFRLWRSVLPSPGIVSSKSDPAALSFTVKLLQHMKAAALHNENLNMNAFCMARFQI
jgi:hypothetical protein